MPGPSDADSFFDEEMDFTIDSPRDFRIDSPSIPKISPPFLSPHQLLPPAQIHQSSSSSHAHADLVARVEALENRIATLEKGKGKEYDNAAVIEEMRQRIEKLEKEMLRVTQQQTKDKDEFTQQMLNATYMIRNLENANLVTQAAAERTAASVQELRLLQTSGFKMTADFMRATADCLDRLSARQPEQMPESQGVF